MKGSQERGALIPPDADHLRSAENKYKRTKRQANTEDLNINLIDFVFIQKNRLPSLSLNIHIYENERRLNVETIKDHDNFLGKAQPTLGSKANNFN